MRRNIGTIDQVIRFMLGLALISYVAKDGVISPGGVPAVLAGALLFVTSIFVRCPLYSLLGFTTIERVDRSS
jgi:Protein of unknown function (DUF2892)